MSQIYRLAGPGGNAQIAAVGAFVNLRIMARPTSDLSNDVTVYLVEEEFGHHARGYVKTDAAEADLETIIRNLIAGRYENPLRVVAFNTAERWSQDVSEDIANELLDRAPRCRRGAHRKYKALRRPVRDPGREAAAGGIVRSECRLSSEASSLMPPTRQRNAQLALLNAFRFSSRRGTPGSWAGRMIGQTVRALNSGSNILITASTATASAASRSARRLLSRMRPPMSA
jgi:hypothetical protein